MAYVPNADQVSEPQPGQKVFSAAEEFRTLKSKLIRALIAPELTEMEPIPALADRAGLWAIWTADGSLGATASPLSGADPTLRTDLANSAAAFGSALVAYKNPGTGGAARSVYQKLQRVIHVDDFGAVGNDSTDDTTAITNALTWGAVLGMQVHFDGTKIYRLNTNTWSIPANSKIRTNGCGFTCPFTTTSNTVWLTVNGNVDFDSIRVNVITGVRRDRGITLSGDKITGGYVELISVDQQPTAEADDFGVRIFGNDINIGSIRVDKYDRPAMIRTSSRVRVGGYYITNYLRGLYFLDSSSVTVGKSWIKTRSPNAGALPLAGEVGVLLGADTVGASHDIELNGIEVENASEHGYRLGGPEAQKNIKFNRCLSRDHRSCGFKVLGTDAGTPTTYNQDISFIDCVVEDGGVSAGAADNRCALLVQFVDGLQVVGLVARPKLTTRCGSYGIRIDAVKNGVISNCLVEKSDVDTYILHAKAANIDNVIVSNCNSLTSQRHAYSFWTDATFTLQNSKYLNCSALSAVSAGMAVSNSGTMTKLVGQVSATSCGSAAICTASTVKLDIEGLPGATAMASVTSQNGSVWKDDTTLNYRKAATWTAL
jgi:hypothetical protein